MTGVQTCALPIWASNPPRLLNALSDTMKIAPTDAARYAINCVQLRPDGGRIAATDIAVPSPHLVVARITDLFPKLGCGKLSLLP